MRSIGCCAVWNPADGNNAIGIVCGACVILESFLQVFARSDGHGFALCLEDDATNPGALVTATTVGTHPNIIGGGRGKALDGGGVIRGGSSRLSGGCYVLGGVIDVPRGLAAASSPLKGSGGGSAADELQVGRLSAARNRLHSDVVDEDATIARCSLIHLDGDVSTRTCIVAERNGVGFITCGGRGLGGNLYKRGRICRVCHYTHIESGIVGCAIGSCIQLDSQATQVVHLRQDGVLVLWIGRIIGIES